MASDFDLRSYLARVGVSRAVAPDMTTLRALHLAHVCAVPFENLDIQMGRPIALDLASLQAKLVAGRRGGYCFEQNTLFMAALAAIGFRVEPCEARVRPGTDRVLPRTHMVLLVSVGERRWLCDVGFGGAGPIEPIRPDGSESEHGGRAYRVAREDSLLVLQRAKGERWEDLYAFVPEARYLVDFEVANWYTSTHPESRFVLTLTAQRSSPESRHILRNLEYTIERGERELTRVIARADLIPLLRDVFGLELPTDARFRALDG